MILEERGKAARRLRVLFAASSVVFVGVLAVSPVKDFMCEWRQSKREFLRFAAARPDSRRLVANYHPGIDQIWIPEISVVDRCTTCHQGIAEPTLLDPSVPQPFRAHPLIPHQVEKWGCVVCHRGQGLATEFKEAHKTTVAWEQPILPIRYIQAACGECHRGELPEAPRLNRGRELLVRLNCVGCHRMEGISRPTMLGPDLTRMGSKVSRAWIYKWLKEPRTLTDSTGGVTVDGYETEAEPRMPKFRLSEEELRALSAYLSTLTGEAIQSYKFDPRVVAALENKPDLGSQGEVRFREMFCTTCHSIAVTRAGETKLIGGDIGPELTKVGSKVNRDWLVAWLRDPQAYLPRSQMPRYRWSDEDLYKVTAYVMAKLTDPELLSDVPQLPSADPQEIALGKRLFLEKGCASCHAVKGVNLQSDFGPDLSSLGGKTVSQLEFGTSKTPRTLVAYIQAKITDPLSVNPAARMPQFHLEADDLAEITTALLSMTGEPPAPAVARNLLPAPHAEFHPAGDFGELYERYKCYVCHRFDGFGGTLAPDLSYEGSRAQRKWLIEFLKHPQTLRPTLTSRMPQFNITDQEASSLADFLALALQAPSVNPARTHLKEYTPEMVALGKQLYTLKYQCQECHTIGSTGGYVGPNLTNAGSWFNAAWIEEWLRNPQALIPGTIEPRRSFTDQEVTALAAYLMTLKQGIPAGGASAGAGTAR